LKRVSITDYSIAVISKHLETLDKMWLFYGKTLTLLLLVAVPFSATILSIVLNDFVPFNISTVELNPGTTTIYTFSYISLVSTITLVYAFYPLKFAIIKKRGFVNILIEYEYIKKILYFETPILIVVMLFVSAQAFFDNTSAVYNFIENIQFPLEKGLETYGMNFYSTTGDGSIQETEDFAAEFLFHGLIINLGFSVTSGIIYIILITIRKDLRFYLAKTFLEIASKEKEEIKKMKYLINSIKFYDRYLRGSLNLQINNIKEIFSNIIIDSSIDKSEAIQSLFSAFENDNDKLKPAKCLSEITHIHESQEFLIEELIGQRIKDLAIFFATIIPVAVGIIQLLLSK